VNGAIGAAWAAAKTTAMGATMAKAKGAANLAIDAVPSEERVTLGDSPRTDLWLQPEGL
jgi:hypothetical protein